MTVMAQQFHVGYLSHSAIMHRMPQYARAQEDLKVLRGQYEAEAKRSEEDFQRKFIEFTEGQKEFPKSILQKRQNELQNMMDTNATFRIQVQQLLAQAEKDMLQDVRAILTEAINAVAEREGLMVILNTDGDAVPFLSPAIGVDVTNLVLQQLEISIEN